MVQKAGCPMTISEIAKLADKRLMLGYQSICQESVL